MTTIKPYPLALLARIMRSTIAAFAILVFLIGTADAEQCPPGALGVSRTLVVDPNEHSRVGSMQYPETLPLNDHEVVLTFDDGPLPRYTSRVLETLASECVKATFFMVGQMARAYPWMVRRVYDEGHTVANHTQNHPIRKMSVDQAAREIEEGFASLREAIGDPQAVSPFFRIPGLLRQKSVEQYLAAHGDMTWSADFVADDWTRINNSEVARRAISRIEARGKGILLLHDIHPRTVLALPEILNEFKSRGYKIVHVVPAAADRPKTATSAQQWVVRPTPEQHTSPSQMRPLR
jgi:peptidoglycan-N-acetylglucosamine deacetylase